jgi:FkbM family methyltransferase
LAILLQRKKSVNIDDIIRLRLKRNKHNILLDIGANYGAFSEYNHDLFKKIYFIEPNTDLLDKLKKKFYKNHKYFFCDFATGDKNEIRSFYITNDSHQSLSSLKKTNDGNERKF